MQEQMGSRADRVKSGRDFLEKRFSGCTLLLELPICMADPWADVLGQLAQKMNWYVSNVPQVRTPREVAIRLFEFTPVRAAQLGFIANPACRSRTALIREHSRLEYYWAEIVCECAAEHAIQAAINSAKDCKRRIAG